ncbi:hypothetical protein Tco_0878569, partial [Tanacetum coccineum]
MALPPRDQRHPFLRFEGLEYTNVDIADFKGRLGKIYDRGVHRVLFKLGGAKQRMSWREFILALGLHTVVEMGSVGATLSYTLIRDPLLRLGHRLIACSIAGRSQAPEKVTSTDFFYLRSIDVGSVNIRYLLAQYLRRYALGRKRGAMISRVYDLPMINMDELVRLQICDRLDDTWAWVALGLERQPDAMAGAPVDVKGAHTEVEGVQAVLASVQ